METDLKVLTSGRFDPPHPGHIINIIELAKKYHFVKVAVLNYPERRYPVCYCVQIMERIFKEMLFKVEFLVNSVHFAEISAEELMFFNCNLYSGGNLTVLKHIERLGIKTEFIDRCYYYEASKIPLPGNKVQILKNDCVNQ